MQLEYNYYHYVVLFYSISSIRCPSEIYDSYKSTLFHSFHFNRLVFGIFAGGEKKGDENVIYFQLS